jgi:hypothetical protein
MHWQHWLIGRAEQLCFGRRVRLPRTLLPAEVQRFVARQVVRLLKVRCEWCRVILCIDSQIAVSRNVENKKLMFLQSSRITLTGI